MTLSLQCALSMLASSALHTAASGPLGAARTRGSLRGLYSWDPRRAGAVLAACAAAAVHFLIQHGAGPGCPPPNDLQTHRCAVPPCWPTRSWVGRAWRDPGHLERHPRPARARREVEEPSPVRGRVLARSENASLSC